jgi:IS5 family transposase
MRTIEEPTFPELFEKHEGVLHRRLVAKLEQGWEGVMRRVLLALMPAEELGRDLSESFGRPSKELYSMAGLIFLAESFGWSHEDAARRYCADLGVQYALNLPHHNQYLCERTYENYLREFRRNDLAQQVFLEVTGSLVVELGVEVKKQRLDSTHVFSDMARFGRTKLMAETTRRFMRKLSKSFPELYGALDADLVQRYAKSDGQLFGMGASRLKGEALGALRLDIARDMHLLIARFENDAAVVALRSYGALVRVFGEQCELVDGAPTLVAKPGCDCTQNPSDPEATYDGHKGTGYQAQIAETFDTDNGINFITAVIPQTAAEQDSNSLMPVVEQLVEQERTPDTLLADTGYGSDENVQAAAQQGVELVAPVAGARKGGSVNGADETSPLHALDFARDKDTGEVVRCPMGNVPLAVGNDGEGRRSAIFDVKECNRCPRQGQCPTANSKTRDRIDYCDKTLRLEARRRHEQTREFKDLYRKRAGVEGTMSALKRGLGLGRLSVRGKMAVYAAIYLKAAAYNMKQAARVLRRRAKRPSTGPVAPVLALSRIYKRLYAVMTTLNQHRPSIPGVVSTLIAKAA